MRYRLALIIAICSGGGSAIAQTPSELAAAAAQIPVEAFFAQANARAPKLSPDGTKVAYLRRFEDGQTFAIYDRKTGETTTMARGLGGYCDDFFWKGNDHLLFYTANGPGSSLTGAVVPLDGSRVKRLHYRHLGMQVVDELHGDPEKILIAGRRLEYSYPLSGGLKTIFDLEVRNFDFRYRDVVVDGFGNLRLMNRIEYKTGISDLLYRQNNAAEWTTLVREPANPVRPSVAIMWISQSGDAAYIVSRHENDRGALYEIDLPSASLGEMKYLPPEGEIQSILHTRGAERFLGVRYAGVRNHTVWFDEKFKQLQATLDEKFPDAVARILDMSSNERVFLVLVHSDKQPGAVYIVDADGLDLHQFRRILPSIDPVLMSPQQAITFTASDGLEIQAYLTRPHLQDAHKRVPLIVLTHRDYFMGRWYWGFDPVAQFLASRGYAVLQINHRGSGGFGRGFMEMGRHELGGAVLQDLCDGVDWAVKVGVADPDRVGIWGGYLALAGITLRPDEFACAVNIGGRADLEIAYRDPAASARKGKNDWDFRNMWIGPTRAHRSEISPLENVEEITAPSFHAYTNGDPAIRPEHAKRLLRKLKKLNIPHEYHLVNGAGSPEDLEEAEFERYRRIEAFLAEHL